MSQVRQCWLNIETGEFSKSWVKGVYHSEVIDELIEIAKDDFKHHKLIEYTCLTDDNFEFMDCMKLS